MTFLEAIVRVKGGKAFRLSRRALGEYEKAYCFKGKIN
jgi:hypothetical protein